MTYVVVPEQHGLCRVVAYLEACRDNGEPWPTVADVADATALPTAAVWRLDGAEGLLILPSPNNPSDGVVQLCR